MGVKLLHQIFGKFTEDRSLQFSIGKITFPRRNTLQNLPQFGSDTFIFNCFGLFKSHSFHTSHNLILPPRWFFIKNCFSRSGRRPAPKGGPFVPSSDNPPQLIQSGAQIPAPTPDYPERTSGSSPAHPLLFESPAKRRRDDQRYNPPAGHHPRPQSRFRSQTPVILDLGGLEESRKGLGGRLPSPSRSWVNHLPNRRRGSS